MSKKKITITNAYTWYNKGDAGILLGTINALKNIYGEKNIEINVLSFTPDEDKKRYCKDKTIKNVYSNILNPRPYKNTKLGKVNAIIKLCFKFIYYTFMMKFNMKSLINKNETYKVMSESDMLIVCGGGFLGGKKLDSLMHVFQMNVNTKFDVPNYLIGTSVEPMKSKIVKKYTDKVLNKLDHVFARETITNDYLNSIMENEKITLMPDMAFMLEDDFKDNKVIQKLKKDSNKVYGITVRHWNFPNSTTPGELMNNYINTLKTILEKEILENNNTFVFVPQVIVNNGDDAETAITIRNRMSEETKEKFVILRDDLSPMEIKTMISNMDAFIGTRMHSNIFATSMKVPTIAIAYEKKTNGIMHTVNLDEYVLEMDEITVDSLNEKIELQNKNYKKIVKNLEITIPKLREEVLTKMKKVLDKE